MSIDKRIAYFESKNVSLTQNNHDNSIAKLPAAFEDYVVLS